MFDFRKEVIINSATLPAEDGGLNRVTNDGEYLKVLRCAEYKIDDITNMVKVLPKAGTASTVVVSPSAEDNATVYKLVIKIGLDNHRMHGEFANDWAKYEKTLTVESDTHTGLKAALKGVLEANPILVELEAKSAEDNGGVEIQANTFACKDLHQVIKSAEVIAYDDKDAEISTKPLEKNDGVRPLNTGDLLIENLRFPSYPNLRYAAEHEEERPIPGALYDLYVFDYVVPRVGLHGQGAVGQQLTSSTTHAFYVLSTLSTVKAEFEKITGKGDKVPVAGE